MKRANYFYPSKLS